MATLPDPRCGGHFPERRATSVQSGCWLCWKTRSFFWLRGIVVTALGANMGLIVSALIHAHKADWHPPYLELVLAFNAAVYVLHTYLDCRQLRASGGKKTACVVCDMAGLGWRCFH